MAAPYKVILFLKGRTTGRNVLGGWLLEAFFAIFKIDSWVAERT